jgi:hypothetical protein
MSDFEAYRSHFPPGMKIVAAIPLRSNELFRDDAVILEIEDDLVSLQLSRDVLPADISLQTGKTLELRGGKDGQGYRCSGNLVSEGEAGVIIVRLTGGINSAEQREYFRIDAFLPIKFYPARGQTLDRVVTEWRSRRERRIALEAERREALKEKRRRETIRHAEQGWRPEDGAEREDEEFAALYPEWLDEGAIAVNISGGGFKFVTTDRFDVGEVVLCEIFIPVTPPRIMDCVVRVVFTSRNYAPKGGGEHHNVATQFMFLEERDRDAIVSHISRLQMIRIGMLRQRSLLAGTDGSGSASSRRLQLLNSAIMGAMALAILIALISYFLGYARSHTKNEIQKNFEEGIRMILERIR